MKEIRLIKKGTVEARVTHIVSTPVVERKLTRRERRWFGKNEERDFVMVPKTQVLEKPKKRKQKPKSAKQLKVQAKSNAKAWLAANQRKQKQIEKGLKIEHQ
jgi:hypothetical protein